MTEGLKMIGALLVVVSPALAVMLGVGVQLLLARRGLPLLAVLPVVSAAMAFCFPEHGSWLFRGFYILDVMGAFAGSLAGALVGLLLRQEKRKGA